MDSNIVPITVNPNVVSKTTTKKEAESKKPVSQPDNTGKIVAGLAALGVLGAASYAIFKKGKGTDEVSKAKGVIPEKLKETYADFVEKINGKYGDELNPHMEEIDRMIGQEDDKTRINSIIELVNKKPSQSLKEKMILGLMKKSEKAPELDGYKHFTLNSLLSNMSDSKEIAPEFLTNVISKMPQSDEVANLNIIATFLDKEKVSKHLTAEHLDGFSEYLDKIKTKEFNFKEYQYLDKHKNVQDLNLSCKLVRFQNEELSEKSISKVRAVLDNQDIAKDVKLTFIDQIEGGKLSGSNHHLAAPLKRELLERVLDMAEIQYKYKDFSSSYSRDINTFYLAGTLYPRVSNDSTEKNIRLTERLQKLFEKTQQADLLKESDDDSLVKTYTELQKSYYDRITRDNLEMRNDVFFDQNKGTIPLDKLGKHADEMVEHFIKAKKNAQQSGESYFLGSIFRSFEYSVNSNFDLRIAKISPEVKAQQQKIREKIQKCGEEHFGFSYSKYYDKTDSSKEKFNYESFFVDRTKESKDFISQTVKELKDDNLTALANKLQDGSISEEEVKTLRKKLAVKLHPDKVQGDEKTKEKATEKMKMLFAHFDLLNAQKM